MDDRELLSPKCLLRPEDADDSLRIEIVLSNLLLGPLSTNMNQNLPPITPLHNYGYGIVAARARRDIGETRAQAKWGSIALRFSIKENASGIFLWQALDWKIAGPHQSESIAHAKTI